MKKTNKDNIIEAIEAYINSSPIRPVLIWFHSNPDIDNARRVIREMNSSSFLEHTARTPNSSCSTAIWNS